MQPLLFKSKIRHGDCFLIRLPSFSIEDLHLAKNGTVKHREMSNFSVYHIANLVHKISQEKKKKNSWS